nr:hypothetical protein Iba_chr03aCG8680 [Ipomoea batatas]GMD07668.1 hypothetical protein Iba_chr06cCG9420 [Ipomoea batatas]
MSSTLQLHLQAFGGGRGSERRQMSPALQLLRLWVAVADLNDDRFGGDWRDGRMVEDHVGGGVDLSSCFSGDFGCPESMLSPERTG